MAPYTVSITETTEGVEEGMKQVVAEFTIDNSGQPENTDALYHAGVFDRYTGTDMEFRCPERFSDNGELESYVTFQYGDATIGLKSVDLGELDTGQVTDMSEMFSGCLGLSNLDVGSFDTSGVLDMSHMFADCRVMESLDMSGFDTGNARSISDMFYRCSQLENLDLGNFDMSLENPVEGMFIWYCKELMTVTLPANLTQAIYFPSQDGRHWEDENGERRSIAALGLPSVMTYRSVADEDPNPPSGEEEEPNPPSGGEETNPPSGGGEEPNPPSGGEKPNPSGGGEGQNPSGGNEKPQPAEQKKPVFATQKIQVQSIALTGISKKIAAGKSIRLTAEIYPKNADNKMLVWTSSDPKCASVSQTGKVSVKKNKKNTGKKVTITATAADGSGKKKSVRIRIK